MSVFTDEKNEYGEDLKPLRCLSFDWVMEGMAVDPQSRLLNLPVEIIGNISQYFSKDDLGRLAQVNTDCLQLARSHQFKSVTLDHSDSSSQIVQKLCAESSLRGTGSPSKNDMLNKSFAPSIVPRPGKYFGSCIRRLTVKSGRDRMEKRHNLELSVFMMNLDRRYDKTARHAHYEEYIVLIRHILISNSMPHLEILDWQDRASLPKSFFTAFALSKVRHFRLCYGEVDEEFEAEIPHDFQWPLQSLHLKLVGGSSMSGSSPPRVRRANTCPLTLSLLRPCAPTLQILKLHGNWDGRAPPFSFASNTEKLCFPKSRRVTINGMVIDPSVPDALMGPDTRVRELELDLGL